MARVVIIGGGISGLVCALRLAPVDGLSVSLVEADDRLGGKIWTERHPAGVFEGGPDGFVSWRREAVDLADTLGVEIVRSAPGTSAVIRNGRPRPIPRGLIGALPTTLLPTLRSSLLGPLGKLRLLAEPLVPRRRRAGDESAEEFVSRRAGRQAWERIAEPLVSGMYAADGARLAARAVFPALVRAEREHGSIARAAMRARRARRGGGGEGGLFATTTEGMGGLVDAIAGRLQGGVDVRTGAGAEALATDGRSWRVRTSAGELAADAVVLAVPAPAAARLLDDTDMAIARDLRAIPFAHAAVAIFVVPDTALPPDAGLGHLVPSGEGTPVVACSIATTKFPDLAVGGSAVVRVFLGRYGDETPSLDDEAVGRIAADHLRRVLRVAGAIEPARIVRIPEAFPQYVAGHDALVQRIDGAARRHAGLFLTGASYRGIGVPDCIASATATAAQVRAALGLG